MRKKKNVMKKITKKLFFCGKNRVNPWKNKKLKQKRTSFFLWKTTVNPLRKKNPVPEKRKLCFKNMRRGFAAHEKTHVLWGGSLL